MHLPSYHYNKVEKNLIKEYRDENGDTYLHDMDSYYYARKAKEMSNNKIRLTEPSDKFRGYISKDGIGSTALAFPAIVSVIWKVVSFLFKNVPFMRFIHLIGPILSALACIPAYIFVRKRTNILGGLVAGFTAAISPAFFDDNGFGCFDTDLLLYILPLVFMCAFIEALQEEKLKKQIIWISLSSFTYILLSYTWGPHIIYYYLAAGLSFIFILITLIKEKFNFKNSIKLSEFRASVVTIIILTIITLLIDKKIDLLILGYLINLIRRKQIFLSDAYPDPGLYITELASISPIAIIHLLGGIFIVLSSVATLIYLFKQGIKYFKERKDDNKNYYILFIVLTTWILGGLVCLTSGSRFTKIIVIPTSLLVGIGMSVVHKFFSKKNLGKLAIFVIIVCIFIIPGFSAINLSKSQAPSSNDALNEVSDWIKNNTSKDSIIISWWDYGYYYEYKAERKTLADGGTFNGRYYYWLGNIFLTEDEALSAGITKMLAYSGIEASILADKYVGDSKKGCEMIKEILVLNKEKATKLLQDKYHLKDKQINRLLKYSHHDLDNEIIVVVTRDMLLKVGTISYYANYDFTAKNNEVNHVDSKTMMYKFYYNQNIHN